MEALNGLRYHLDDIVVAAGLMTAVELGADDESVVVIMPEDAGVGAPVLQWLHRRP